MTRKLTLAQLKVLKRAIELGGVISFDDWYCRIGRGSGFGMTLDSLEKRGFFIPGPGPREKTITEAGRNAEMYTRMTIREILAE